MLYRYFKFGGKKTSIHLISLFISYFTRHLNIELISGLHRISGRISGTVSGFYIGRISGKINIPCIPTINIPVIFCLNTGTGFSEKTKLKSLCGHSNMLKYYYFSVSRRRYRTAPLRSLIFTTALFAELSILRRI
jgi:hypothetical protein